MVSGNNTKFTYLLSHTNMLVLIKGNTQLTRSRYRPISTEGDYCYLKNATGKDNTFGNPDRYSVGVLLL